MAPESGFGAFRENYAIPPPERGRRTYFKAHSGLLMLELIWPGNKALKGLIPPFLLPSIIPVTVAFAALSFNLQKRVIRTSEMRSKRVPKVVPFLVPFWSQFWPQNGPKMVSKVVKKLVISGPIFGSLFCWVLELFGSLLGAFLGLLRLSWEAFGPQKP